MTGNPPEPHDDDQIALVNGRLVLPTEIVSGKALLLHGGKITAIARAAEIGSDIRRVDAQGRLIAPGLVDIHTHGALGHTFNEATIEAFTAITAENARRGVTSLLATTITASIPDLIACLDFSRRWINNAVDERPPVAAELLGVHLEGPYFCGENGHLTFNDPPYALFDDPLWVKVVELADASRRQQVGEGHFTSLQDVPTHTITLTIPALLAARNMLCLVPEMRKAKAVRACLYEPISEQRPASILRRQAHARLYLDPDSAAGDIGRDIERYLTSV